MKNNRPLRSLVPLALVAFALTLTGCKDSDYDFDNVDTIIGLGGDELALPTDNTTKDIMPDDLLDLNNSNFIHIASNGDYNIEIRDNDWHRSYPSVDQFTVNNPATTSGNLPVVPGTNSATLTTFSYSGVSVPTSIKALDYIGGTATLDIAITVPQSVRQISSIALTLPQYLSLSRATIDGTTTALTNNSVTLTNLAAGSHHLLLSLQGLSIGQNANDNGRATFDATSSTVDIMGAVTATATVAQSDFTTEGLAALTRGKPDNLSASISIPAITVNSATGRFAPDINLDELGRVTLSNVPDFLEGNDVNLNLYNPQIYIDFQNALPLGGIVSGTLVARDAYGQQLASVMVEPFEIPAGESVVCISKLPMTFTDGTVSVVADNLSDLVRRIPDNIVFTDVNARGNDRPTVTMQLGQTYEVATRYSVRCPLQFDDDAVIIYRDSTDGWNDTMKDLSFVQSNPSDPTSISGTVTVEADVANKLPVYLTVEVQPMDVDGNAISSNLIPITVDKTVAASDDGTTPKTTHITLTMRPRSNDALHTLDGLKFIVYMTAAETDGSNPIAGKTINAYNQTLRLTNISVTKRGKVVGDF